MQSQRSPSRAFPGGSAATSWMEYFAEYFICDVGREKNIRRCFSRARAGFAGVYRHDAEAKAGGSAEAALFPPLPVAEPTTCLQPQG